MHALTVIKNACIEALDDEGPRSQALFHAVVDPGSVLEMSRIIELLVESMERTRADPELVARVKQELRGGLEGTPMTDVD